MSQKPLTIIISRSFAPDKPTYENWLRSAYQDLNIINTYPLRDNPVALDAAMQDADGILITGGEDVNPSIYNQENTYSVGINDSRDTLEVSLIKFAQANSIPLMCVCRGHQLLNAVLGGTLYQDIPAQIQKNASLIINHRLPTTGAKEDAHHAVTVAPGSTFSTQTGAQSGVVTSYHHQSIQSIAPGFRAVAKSTDGIIEAIEPSNPEAPFVLGVQWHPERMDFKLPLSGKVAAAFLNAVEKHQAIAKP